MSALADLCRSDSDEHVGSYRIKAKRPKDIVVRVTGGPITAEEALARSKRATWDAFAGKFWTRVVDPAIRRACDNKLQHTPPIRFSLLTRWFRNIEQLFEELCAYGAHKGFRVAKAVKQTGCYTSKLVGIQVHWAGEAAQEEPQTMFAPRTLLNLEAKLTAFEARLEVLEDKDDLDEEDEEDD